MFKLRIIKKDILKVPSNIPQTLLTVQCSLYVQQRVSQEIVATAQNPNPLLCMGLKFLSPLRILFESPPPPPGDGKGVKCGGSLGGNPVTDKSWERSWGVLKYRHNFWFSPENDLNF